MVSRIGFVCDSTADFPPGVAERLGLNILPVHIVVDGRDHLHGVSISNAEVLDNLKQKRQVFTKPFLPAECADLYERLLARHERIVSFHLSNSLSGNYNSACNALRLLADQDAARIKVIDMGAVSVSLGLAVKKAVALLIKNPDIDTLDKLVEDIRLVEIGATISVHAGPGSVCVGMIPM